MSIPKIAVYNLAGMLTKFIILQCTYSKQTDLKNTTDDALPNYLNSLKFKQSHNLTDVRLALGYAAVVIAGLTFYFDFKLGWDQTKYWTLWAVVVYFLLNGALTLWIWNVEKGTVFVGNYNHTMVNKRSPNKFADNSHLPQLSIASSVTKYNPVYKLTVRYSDRNSGWKQSEISAPFARWFDSEGHFVARPFQLWLRSEVPLIGQADPRGANDSLGEAEDAPSEAIPEAKIEASGTKVGGKSVRDTTASKSRKFKS